VPSSRSSRVPASRHSLANPARALRAIWHETSGPLRITWIALWGIGLILLALGIYGDNTGFWNDKPYLTNTISELTTAAFGVPVALVVLQRMADLESDAAAARAARRMAARVSADLAAAVSALARDDIPAIRAARERLRDQRETLLPDGDYWRPAAAPRIYYQPFSDAIEKTMQSVGELFAPEPRQQLADIAGQWSVLTNEARSRLLEAGQQWIGGLEAQELEALVRKVTEPTLESCRTRALELREWYRREDQLPASGGHRYGEMDTLREFASWFTEILSYLDRVIELAAKSAATARALAAP
jgi:hypothetical protein